MHAVGQTRQKIMFSMLGVYELRKMRAVRISVFQTFPTNMKKKQLLLKGRDTGCAFISHDQSNTGGEYPKKKKKIIVSRLSAIEKIIEIKSYVPAHAHTLGKIKTLKPCISKTNRRR